MSSFGQFLSAKNVDTREPYVNNSYKKVALTGGATASATGTVAAGLNYEANHNFWIESTAPADAAGITSQSIVITLPADVDMASHLPECVFINEKSHTAGASVSHTVAKGSVATTNTITVRYDSVGTGNIHSDAKQVYVRVKPLTAIA